MKILIDLTSLADNFSGIERYALNISLELIKHKEHRFILCFKEKVFPLFEEFAKQANIEFVVLKRCNKLLFYQFRLPRAIRKFKVDYYLFPAFPVPLTFGKKNIISTVHDLCCWDCPETMTLKSRLYFKAGIRHSIKISRKIVTVSEFSKSRIIEKFKCDKNKILVCYDGLEEKFIRQRLSCHDYDEVDKKYNLPSKFILSLSTIEPRKNIKLLIKAYNYLVKEDNGICDLVLAGRAGWKIDDLMDGVDGETRNKIHFTGFIEDADLPHVYARAQVFVFPSKYEGFGLPPLEALACGSTVLSSDAASLPEVLGEAAFYFENENIDSLIGQLKNVLSMTEERKKETYDLSYEQCLKFSWESEARKLINSI